MQDWRDAPLPCCVVGYCVYSTMTSAGHQSDLRNSVRFPLHLEVILNTKAGELHAKTTDVSSGGVLFRLDAQIEVDSPVEFAIEMPAEMLGTEHPVRVVCTGRVVRCTKEASGNSVAVVIDEYHFKRQQRNEGQ